jgi:nitroreductase
MQVMEALASRRSVRAYTDEPVERATVERLVRAATLVPSGMNTQPWAFGVIEGAERLRLLSDRVKTDLLSKLSAVPALERYREALCDPAYNVFYGAPVLVVVYARPMPYDGRGACAMAALGLMLAARDAGLGTCWIGFSESLLESQALKAELGVPAGYRVVAPVIVGHPVAFPAPTPRAEPEYLYWK